MTYANTVKACAVALSIPFLLPTARASTCHGEELLSIYTDLNEMCRGWSGDDPQTDEACAVRTKVSTLLWKEGYCFGKHGQSGGEAWWHKCTKDSYRFGEEWK